MKKDIIITDELIYDILDSVYDDGNGLEVDKEYLKNIRGYQVEEKKSAMEIANDYITNLIKHLEVIHVCKPGDIKELKYWYEKAITELQEEIEKLKKEDIEKNCENCKHDGINMPNCIGCIGFSEYYYYSKWEPKNQ